MSFYGNLAETAKRLITDKGRTVSIKYRTSGTYDPDNDTNTGASNTTVSTKAAILDYDERLVDGTLIQAGDKKALLFAKGVTKPKTGDILVDGGVEYNIVRNRETGPGDTPVLYTLQIRK